MVGHRDGAEERGLGSSFGKALCRTSRWRLQGAPSNGARLQEAYLSAEVPGILDLGLRSGAGESEALHHEGGEG